MNSPVEIAFEQFIKIDRRKSDPIYLQIVYQLINAVKTRLLGDGDRLPGSRKISRRLGVNRQTVVAAFEELEAQGWIEIRPQVGTFIKTRGLRQKSLKLGFRLSKTAGFSFKKSFVLDTPIEKHQYQYHFTDGTPDYRIIKTDELARFYSAVLKRKRIAQKLTQNRLYYDVFFKKQLSYYLNLTRNFHISPQELLISSNKEILFQVLSELLVEEGHLVLVSEWSYYFLNMIMRQSGARLQVIPMDKEGIKVDYIRQNFRKGSIRCLLVKPQHQYPTGICLSAKRRAALIELAEDYDFFIIEDDTDYELTYQNDKTLPLLSTDHYGRVVYLGTFGQFLIPGFQYHFMIAPENMMVEASKYLNVYEASDRVKEQALGEMIKEGDIHRYRRKAVQLYLKRRDCFNELLSSNFSGQIVYELPRGGLAFWVEFNQKISLHKLRNRALNEGLFIPQICLYQNRYTTAMRLGFGHLNELEMKNSIQILKKVVDNQLRAEK